MCCEEKNGQSVIGAPGISAACGSAASPPAPPVGFHVKKEPVDDAGAVQDASARQNSSILACLALASAVLTLFWPWDPRSRHLKLCEGAGHGLLFSAVCPQPEEGSSEAALTTETLVQLMFRRCLPRTWAPAGSLGVPVASEADALRLCRRTLPALKDLPALPAPA